MKPLHSLGWTISAGFLAMALGAVLAALAVSELFTVVPRTNGKIMWGIDTPSSDKTPFSSGGPTGGTPLDMALSIDTKDLIVVTCFAGSADACNQADGLVASLKRAGREVAFVETWGDHYFTPDMMTLDGVSHVFFWPQDLMQPQGCKTREVGEAVVYDCNWR